MVGATTCLNLNCSEGYFNARGAHKAIHKFWNCLWLHFSPPRRRSVDLSFAAHMGEVQCLLVESSRCRDVARVLLHDYDTMGNETFYWVNGVYVRNFTDLVQR